MAMFCAILGSSSSCAARCRRCRVSARAHTGVRRRWHVYIIGVYPRSLYQTAPSAGTLHIVQCWRQGGERAAPKACGYSFLLKCVAASLARALFWSVMVAPAPAWGRYRRGTTSPTFPSRGMPSFSTGLTPADRGHETERESRRLSRPTVP